MLWVFINALIHKKRCSVKVVAKCIRYKTRHNTSGYTPVYEITWKGQNIEIYRPVYIKSIIRVFPKVGDTTTLHVNPNNPLDFYSKFYLLENWGVIFCGLLFIFLPIYFNFFYKP